MRSDMKAGTAGSGENIGSTPPFILSRQSRRLWTDPVFLQNKKPLQSRLLKADNGNRTRLLSLGS